MIEKSLSTIVGVFSILAAASSTWAGLSPAEIEQLSTILSPLGGEIAGNRLGTIPPWRGGLTQPPPGYVEGRHYVDPFTDDEILFTITANNMHKYPTSFGAENLYLKSYPVNSKPKPKTMDAIPVMIFRILSTNFQSSL